MAEGVRPSDMLGRVDNQHLLCSSSATSNRGYSPSTAACDWFSAMSVASMLRITTISMIVRHQARLLILLFRSFWFNPHFLWISQRWHEPALAIHTPQDLRLQICIVALGFVGGETWTITGGFGWLLERFEPAHRSWDAGLKMAQRRKTEELGRMETKYRREVRHATNNNADIDLDNRRYEHRYRRPH